MRSNEQKKTDMSRVRYEVADKEAMERGAKSVWNKFTRLLDKFTEIIFILCLVGVGSWNIASMFVGEDPADKGFSILRTLLAVYMFFIAFLIFISWRANITFLAYFGFMRGSFSKALFLLFAGCLCFPNDHSTKNLDGLQWVIAVVLCIAASLQLLKFFNKKENVDHLGSTNNNLKAPMQY